MNKIGLIGKKLGHSLSPELFQGFFENEKLMDWDYSLYELKELNELANLIQQNKLRGLNVTVPFKQEIIPLLQELSEEAKEVGAVNTVKVQKSGLVGYNTDVYGFEKMIWLNDVLPTNVLILGSGGASKAVQFVLNKRAINFEIVSRTPSSDTILYDDLDDLLFKEFDTIVNTTPLGMFPNIIEMPEIPYQAITKHMTAIDLIYNPEETLFLGLARANGAKTINGKVMLESQALKAWEIFKS